MIKALKAHDFGKVYEALGLNLATLGCVMADLGPIDIEIQTTCRSHFSKNEERFWIKGYVADTNPHVTLLYGLIQKANNYKWHIDQVLEGWKLDEVEIEDFGYFDSPYADEQYYCVVAHIKVTPELLDGHQRLSFLPHINTFPVYTPHITIAYIEKDEKELTDLLDDLNERYKGKKLKVTNIKLGK
jgi:2'-5' RNA ligase